MKLLILGHARHGKTTAANVFEEEGWATEDSSVFACRHVIYPKWGRHRYDSPEACHADRSRHRAKWFQMIRDYNTPDGARLAREMLAYSDIYAGMRRIEEFEACKKQGLFDLIIWVNAEHRKPVEGAESMELDAHVADIIIDNNDDPQEFDHRCRRLAKALRSLRSIERPHPVSKSPFSVPTLPFKHLP